MKVKTTINRRDQAYRKACLRQIQGGYSKSSAVTIGWNSNVTDCEQLFTLVWSFSDNQYLQGYLQFSRSSISRRTSVEKRRCLCSMVLLCNHRARLQLDGRYSSLLHWYSSAIHTANACEKCDRRASTGHRQVHPRIAKPTSSTCIYSQSSEARRWNLTLNDSSRFSPPQISIPGSYMPSCSNQSRSMANRPPAMVGLLDIHSISLVAVIWSSTGSDRSSSLFASFRAPAWHANWRSDSNRSHPLECSE